MQPQTPQPNSDPSSVFSQPVDQQALQLTHAIALQESSKDGKTPDYNAVGDNGTSTGAYQWQPGNFEAAAKMYGLDPNDMSPENQDKVAYAQVKAYKDKGYDPGQIASLWNSGSPDNWQNHSGSTVINGKTISYDTPKYVQGVQKYYQQLGGQGNGQIGAGDGGAKDTSTDITGGAIPVVDSIANFLAPSIGDVKALVTGQNKKTPLQLLGDLGSTALGAATLVPGLDLLADPLEATKGAEVAGEAAKAGSGLLGTLGKNAALGAGFGATNALGAGETNPGQIAGSALTGGLVGGGLGLAGEGLSKLVGGSGEAATAESRLQDLLQKNKTLARSFEDNSTALTDPIKTLTTKLTEDGKPLTSLLKVSDGRVDVSGLTNSQGSGVVDNLIESTDADAKKLVASMKGGVPIAQLRQDLLAAVNSNSDIAAEGKVPQAEADIERRLASYQKSYGDEIPYKAIDAIRTKMNKVYDPAERDVARTIGDQMRSYLYNGSDTNTALKSAMQNEAELIKTQNFLGKLNGATVKGGRLGKYVSRGIGTAVGSAIGSAGGPITEGVGGLVGSGVGNAVEDFAQKNYFNPQFSGLISGVKGVARGAGRLAKVGILRNVK